MNTTTLSETERFIHTDLDSPEFLGLQPPANLRRQFRGLINLLLDNLVGHRDWNCSSASHACRAVFSQEAATRALQVPAGMRILLEDIGQDPGQVFAIRRACMAAWLLFGQECQFSSEVYANLIRHEAPQQLREAFFEYHNRDLDRADLREKEHVVRTEGSLQEHRGYQAMGFANGGAAPWLSRCLSPNRRLIGKCLALLGRLVRLIG